MNRSRVSAEAEAAYHARPAFRAPFVVASEGKLLTRDSVLVFFCFAGGVSFHPGSNPAPVEIKFPTERRRRLSHLHAF